MDLLIMSYWEAIEYLPEKPTYALRIFPSWGKEYNKKSLKDSPFYLFVVEYTFDDLGPSDSIKERDVLFNKNLAEMIINDLDKNKLGIENLLIHCNLGKNRSPAVGIALNEIFNLGHDTNLLKQKYPGSNKYIYKILKEVGESNHQK